MDLQIDNDPNIKCGIPIKPEILDWEFYEQDSNIDGVTNLNSNSEAAEKVIVKEENDEFEEEFHVLEDICIKSENCMENSDLDEKLCKKSLSQNSTLTQHVKVHTGKKTWCPIPKKTFSNVQHSKKKYKCDICEKSFTRVGNLQTHLLVHTNDFECTICYKSYSKKSTLKRHFHLHTRKNKCDICEKSFTRNSTLKRHIMSVHAPTSNFKRTICDKSFSQKVTLNQLKVHHIREHFKIDEKQEIKYEDGIKMEFLDCELQDNEGSNLDYVCETVEKLKSVKEENKQHIKVNHNREYFKIDEKQDIKYVDEIKMEVLDTNEQDDANNINEDSNLDYKSEDLDKLKIVKEENDKFKETLQDLGVTDTKFERL